MLPSNINNLSTILAILFETSVTFNQRAPGAGELAGQDERRLRQVHERVRYRHQRHRARAPALGLGSAADLAAPPTDPHRAWLDVRQVGANRAPAYGEIPRRRVEGALGRVVPVCGELSL